MAATIVVTLNKDIPELAAYTKGGTGKALARESDKLDFTARRCKVDALSSMLSENPAALAAQMEAEGFDPSKMRLPPERWFNPADGLVSVRAILAFVAANLNDFRQPNPILRDLKTVEALLVAAQASGAGFHFTRAVA